MSDPAALRADPAVNFKQQRDNISTVAPPSLQKWAIMLLLISTLNVSAICEVSWAPSTQGHFADVDVQGRCCTFLLAGFMRSHPMASSI